MPFNPTRNTVARAHGQPAHYACMVGHPVLLLLLLPLMLAGCLQPSRDEAPSGTMIGTTWLRTAENCTEQLYWDESGVIHHALGLPGGALPAWRHAKAAWSGRPGAMQLHGMPARLDQHRLYCGQAGLLSALPLDLQSIALGGGHTPLTLDYRLQFQPDGTAFLLGRDPLALLDRFALWVDGSGTVRGVALDAPDMAEGPPYSRGMKHPVMDVFEINTISLVHLPHETFSDHLPAMQTTGEMRYLLLHLAQAVDVTIGPDPRLGLPGCPVRHYTDANFWFLSATSPIAGDGSAQTISLNPLAPVPIHLLMDITLNPEIVSVPLIPLAVLGLDGTDCTLLIRASASAPRMAQERLAAQPGADRVGLGLQGAGLALRVSTPGALLQPHIFPWGDEALPPAGFPLHGAAWRTPAAPAPMGATAPDWLALGTEAPQPREITLGGTSGQEHLNIFDDALPNGGWGPFVREATPEPADTLPLPGTWAGPWPDGARSMDIQLVLDTPERVTLQSTGTLPLAIQLLSPHGDMLAQHEGDASAGMGFQLTRYLEPGGYVVRLFPLEGAGATSVSATVTPWAGPGAAPTDTALDTCLAASGWSTSQPALLNGLHCPHMGIQSLAGLDTAAPGLKELVLTGNPVEDLTPLGNLPLLRRLALGATPSVDLTPLLLLKKLHALHLGHRPISANEAALLAGMDHLLLLDLRGATLPDDALWETLRAALPATTILGGPPPAAP